MIKYSKALLILFLTYIGVKATYLLAVAFLEIIRFSSNGGILNVGPTSTASRSAFSCVFEYLKSPNLMPAVSQCLTAIIYRAFETALGWMVLSHCVFPSAVHFKNPECQYNLSKLSFCMRIQVSAMTLPCM